MLFVHKTNIIFSVSYKNKNEFSIKLVKKNNKMKLKYFSMFGFVAIRELT